jgi:hypothetical protein
MVLQEFGGINCFRFLIVRFCFAVRAMFQFMQRSSGKPIFTRCAASTGNLQQKKRAVSLPVRRRTLILVLIVTFAFASTIIMQFTVILTANTSVPRLTKRSAAVHRSDLQQNRTRFKVAAFTKAWSTHSFGGLGKHADNLYRSLAKRGHTVHVFTSAIRPVRSQEIEVGE